jgi:hypothetical protein
MVEGSRDEGYSDVASCCLTPAVRKRQSLERRPKEVSPARPDAEEGSEAMFSDEQSTSRKTPESDKQFRAFLASIDTGTLVGLRDELMKIPSPARPAGDAEHRGEDLDIMACTDGPRRRLAT